jgi:hypothetical protein
MATLDSLPPDQRAVLALVLQRGRTYDEIAEMLAIDRAAVRQRALDGFDALGPTTSISSIERSLITDYLLGQLPPLVAEEVHKRLAGSPTQRAWARVIASELAPLSAEGLPEIPASSASAPPSPPEPQPEPEVHHDSPSVPVDAAAATGEPTPATGRQEAATPAAGPSSRRGGAVLLGGLALLVVAVIVIVLIVGGGGGSSHPHHTSVAATGTRSGTTTATGTSTTVQKLGQINLTSPTNRKTLGVAVVAESHGEIGMVLVAQNLPANNHNAYGVWLYSGPGQQHFLGFYNGVVGSSGKMEVQAPLPANYTSYKQLLVTLETGKPTHPGTIVLQGSV